MGPAVAEPEVLAGRIVIQCLIVNFNINNNTNEVRLIINVDIKGEEIEEIKRLLEQLLELAGVGGRANRYRSNGCSERLEF